MRKVMQQFSLRRSLFVLVAALLALALSACDWQSLGFGTTQTRFNPESKRPSSLTTRWEKQIFGGVETTPTIANGIIYVGDGFRGAVHALNGATGSALWTFETGSDEVDSSPAVANGIVYF